MFTTQAELDRARKILDQIDAAYRKGVSPHRAARDEGITYDEMIRWLDALSLPQEPGEVLNASHLCEAVVPVLRDLPEFNVPEQIGSGVLVDLEQGVFLFTAAHVLDQVAPNRPLLIPDGSSIQPLAGHVMHGQVPQDGKRQSDIYDVAFFRLDQEWATSVRKRSISIGCPQMTPQLPACGDIVTFVGYPHRLTVRKPGLVQGDLTTYSGHVVCQDALKGVPFDHELNIAAKVRRRQMFSTRHNNRGPAVKPHGISGGLILAWPTTLASRHEPQQLRAVGIAHTFKEDRNIMIGTSFKAYFDAIAKLC